MTKEVRHLKAYSLIKKNRIVRKINIYKLALSVVIDKTTAIYLIVIGVYVLASFFIVNDFISDYYENFLFFEDQAKENIRNIFTVLPMAYLFQSFKSPGVVFSSSEYQLSLLPYSRKKIWLLTALEKWIKQLLILTIIGLLIIFITPISPMLVIAYIVIFIFLNIVMTIPQWKLFQTGIVTKLCWFFAMLLINMINFMLKSPIINLLLVICLICLNLFLKQTLFKKIKWGRVTEICDFQIWTMWFISKVSEVEIKRQKRYSLFENFFKRKKPFQYNKQSIHRRLWYIYLGKNIQHLGKIIGALLILLFVFSWIDGITFYIVIAISFYIYFSVARSFFIGRFQADIVQVLPWNLVSYKHSFFKWVMLGGFVLFIPIGIYFVTNISVWLPLQLIYFLGTFIYLYHVIIDKSISFLGKDYSPFDITELIGYLLLIGIIFSWKYKFIFFLSLMIPLLIRKKILTKHIHK